MRCHLTDPTIDQEVASSYRFCPASKFSLIAYASDPEQASTLLARASSLQPTDVRLQLLASALLKAGHTFDARLAQERVVRASANLEKTRADANQLLELASPVSK